MTSSSSSPIFAKTSSTSGSPVARGCAAAIRLFLAWLRRANVTGALNVDWDDRLPTRPAIDDEQRFAILRRLLHDPELDPRDRFAGSVLLLYGKPTTRIAALRTTDIHTTPDGEITLRLGRGEIPLPEPLAAIAQGAARPTASADRDRRVADPGPARRAAHHRRQAAATPEALRDRAQPRGATRRAARARRAAPGADPCRADRDPPVPRGGVGPHGRGDIRRLRRRALPPVRVRRLATVVRMSTGTPLPAAPLAPPVAPGALSAGG